jgi:hypothetical protein
MMDKFLNDDKAKELCKNDLGLPPVSAGFGVAERNEAQATSGRAKVGRGCEAQRSEAIPNRTDSGF